MSTDTDDYALDDKTEAELTVNSGKANSINKICSFNVTYWYDTSGFDSSLLTGEITSCIYAFDESLSDYNAAGNLYSQLMESTTTSEYNDKETYIYNGNIKYSNNKSVAGMIHISAYYENYSSAIEPFLISDEQLAKAAQSSEGISIETLEDIDELGMLVSKKSIEFEELYNLQMKDLSPEPDNANDEIDYTLYNSTFLGIPCSLKTSGKTSLLSNSEVLAFFCIEFEDVFTKAEFDDLNTKLTDILGEADYPLREESFWYLGKYNVSTYYNDNRPSFVWIDK